MSISKFFDVHTHTQDKQYDTDREAVILRALDAGVEMIQVGTDFEMSQKAVKLAEKYENVYPHTKNFGVGVYATVGLHPTDNKKEEFDYETYKKLALASKKIVAVGECGLDYFRGADEAEKERQKSIFIKQIELAKDLGKPLMIHCREAFEDLIEILKENMETTPQSPLLNKEGEEKGISFFDERENIESLSKPTLLTKERGQGGEVKGVVHFFSGSIFEAKTLLDLGFYFSFGGVITFARDYDEQIKFIPMDKILLETDAPYVAPVPYRGKRNEPLYVIEVAKKIAEIKGATLEEVAHTTYENTKSVFNIGRNNF